MRVAGLRATQKLDRDRRILDAATALFRNRGYEATHIEQIAEMAGLSVGTLYNYYKNKGDLLVAIVSVEVHDILAAGQVLVAMPPADAAVALDALVAIYYDHSLYYMDKAMWRHAVAMTVQQAHTPSAQIYMALDLALVAQVTALIRQMQLRALIRADVPADPLGAMVFNNLDRMFLTYIRDDTMTLADLKSAVSAQHAVIARGLAIQG